MQFHQPLHATLHYRITTPMFLGGEGQTPDEEVFRAASFKGALRFWWRALNWARTLEDEECHGQQEAALRLLHKREGALFGSASDDGGASHQSRVLLRCELTSCGTLSAGDTSLNNVSYLLGQGLCSYDRQIRTTKLTRAALKEGAQLDVHITIKPGDSAEADMAQVLRAAKALGCFGGLGSRARRGFGSLSLEWLNVDGSAEERFDSREDVETFIATLPRSAPWETAPLTAFTSGSRFHIGSQSEQNALRALKSVCDEMQMYRSYGRNGRVNGRPAERKFPDDHDTALSAAKGQPIDAPPQRIVFGLPSGYHFSSGGDVMFNAKLGSAEIRRASPLFIHIHAVGTEGFVAVQSLLPALFLPEGASIEATPKRSRARGVPFNGVDYGVIREYMQRFDGNAVEGTHHA